MSWDNKCLSHKANTEAKQLKRKRRHKQFHLWMESVYICFIIWCFFFYLVLVCYLFGLFVISLIFSGQWMRVGGWWIDDSLLKVYAWQLISYQCHRGAIAGQKSDFLPLGRNASETFWTLGLSYLHREPQRWGSRIITFPAMREAAVMRLLPKTDMLFQNIPKIFLKISLKNLELFPKVYSSCWRPSWQ